VAAIAAIVVAGFITYTRLQLLSDAAGWVSRTERVRYARRDAAAQPATRTEPQILMSTGADNKTMAQTKAFDAGHERIYGNRKPQRGRWVQDPQTGKLIPAHEYVPAPRALDAPICVDRFMENTVAQDGTDIGSRAKRKDYMRRERVGDASDYSKEFFAKRRDARDRELSDSTSRTVAELAKVDTRNLPNAVEHLRRQK